MARKVHWPSCDRWTACSRRPWAVRLTLDPDAVTCRQCRYRARAWTPDYGKKYELDPVGRR